MTLIGKIVDMNDELKKTVNSLESNETIEVNEKRVIGRIIKVAKEKGYGFITSKDVPFTRIFFHWTSLKQDTKKFTELEEGMNVEFTPITIENKGYRAIKIIVVDKAK